MVSVSVHNLHYHYEDGHVALRNLSFSINEGETVGLIGPNGAGKSTLLLHLNGILPETLDGPPAVTIRGVALTASTALSIRREVGLLFQDPDDQLFCPTVYEDVAFGPMQFGMTDREVAEAVHDALHKAALIGYERRSPHHLSSGEKQRVCLAGILACRPSILALDEPTRGLDPRGRRQLRSLLRSIDATKIVASHDLELIAELCTRVILMDEGCIIADGPMLELLSNEDLMLAHGLEKPHILKHQHPH